MRTGLVIASALLAASCNAAPDQVSPQVQETSAATDEPAPNEIRAAQAPGAQPASPPTFAVAVAQSDMFEIATSKLAIEKGQSAATREFAKKMVDDHTASTRDLRALVAKSELPIVLPSRLDARQQGILDRLAQANAADFDREYMNQQFDEHATALKLHQEFQEASEGGDLLTFSRKVLPVIQAHYDHLAQTDAVKGREKSGSVKQ